MGLLEVQQSRQEVDVAYREGADWITLTPLINRWFRELKIWESTDNFNTAFQEKRMTVRQVNIGSTARGGSFPVDGKLMHLARDISGIQSRMAPANYFNPEDLRRCKNELGLHDLSASLLTNTRPIKSQLKHYEEVIALFMPLSNEEDLYLFDSLNKTAKNEPAGAILMRTLRSQLTRIKLAQASDMGATYSDVGPGETRGHFRYGLNGTIVPESQRGKLVKTARAATEEELFNRKTNALHYKSILNNPVVTVNEIVMAYRSHASPLFPMFALWNKDARHFRVINTVDMTPTTNIITNQGNYGHG
jgi:hypothetical protein